MLVLLYASYGYAGLDGMPPEEEGCIVDSGERIIVADGPAWIAYAGKWRDLQGKCEGVFCPCKNSARLKPYLKSLKNFGVNVFCTPMVALGVFKLLKPIAGGRLSGAVCVYWSVLKRAKALILSLM